MIFMELRDWFAERGVDGWLEDTSKCEFSVRLGRRQAEVADGADERNYSPIVRNGA
jgi:hypothetical protein